MITTSSNPGGALLRELRERAGRSQLDVEVETGLGMGYLQRVERGKVRQPERHTLNRILDALQVPYRERRTVLEQFGYHSSTPLPCEQEIIWARKECHKELHAITFPAYLLDCGQRLLAWNRYIPPMIGLEHESPAMQCYERRTIIEIVFAPIHGVAYLFDNTDMFMPYFMRVLRHELLPYQNEPWCQELLASALTMPLFQKYWTLAEHYNGHDIAARALIPLQVYASGAGTLQFRLTVNHFTQDPRFRIVYFVPADSVTLQWCDYWANRP